jgi:hypothetical protein
MTGAVSAKIPIEHKSGILTLETIWLQTNCTYSSSSNWAACSHRGLHAESTRAVFRAVSRFLDAFHAPDWSSTS